MEGSVGPEVAEVGDNPIVGEERAVREDEDHGEVKLTIERAKNMLNMV